MHRWLRRLRPFLGVTLVLLTVGNGLPMTAHAEDTSEDTSVDWTDWTPSFTIGIGINSRDVSSNLFGGFAVDEGDFGQIPLGGSDVHGEPDLTFCQARQNLAAPAECILDDVGGESSFSLAGAVVPIGVTFLSPAIPYLPGKPRGFFQAGYGFPQGSESELGIIQLIPILNPTETKPIPRQPSLLNVRTTAKPVGVWWAGIGASFGIPMGEYNLDIRPSLNYFGERIDHEVVLDEQLGVLRDETLNPVTGEFGQQFFKTTHTSTDVWHGFAPGIGLSVELGRRGPIGIGLYADTLFAIFFEERSVAFSRISKPIPTNLSPIDPDQQPRPFSAPGRGEVLQVYDRYTIVAHAGLRFTWHGND